jgi:hypothetical protein
VTERVQPFDFFTDLSLALLWQYDKAVRLQSLVASKQAWYDAQHSGFWSDWIRDVFDLRTANDFGLTVWAQILNLPLLALAPASGDREVFGFGEFNLNFENGNFGRDVDAALSLSTEQRRLALRLRYFQLVTRGTVPEVNAFLDVLFGDEGSVYVLDSLDMETATYVFTFLPDPSVTFVLEQFDLLPRPAGVGVRILINPADRFGFDPYYLNFENSNYGGA